MGIMSFLAVCGAILGIVVSGLSIRKSIKSEKKAVAQEAVMETMQNNHIATLETSIKAINVNVSDIKKWMHNKSEFMDELKSAIDKINTACTIKGIFDKD